MIEHIARLDADVISIEASRSGMELLEVFARLRLPRPDRPWRLRHPLAARALGRGDRRAARPRRGAHPARPAVGEPRLRSQDPRLAGDVVGAQAPRGRGAGEASGGADVIAPLATTGVGSLPFADAPAAVRHAVRAYDIPFCPQLPAHDGDMIREWLGADPRRCGWSAGRDRERPTAWEAFLAACTEHDRRLVKLQVTGPVTLAVALERAAGRRGQGGRSASWRAASRSGSRPTLPARSGLSPIVASKSCSSSTSPAWPTQDSTQATRTPSTSGTRSATPARPPGACTSADRFRGRSSARSGPACSPSTPCATRRPPIRCHPPCGSPGG